MPIPGVRETPPARDPCAVRAIAQSQPGHHAAVGPNRQKKDAPAAKPAVVAPCQFPRRPSSARWAASRKYRLPNGLQVLLFPDAAQTTTTVNITYRVGSRHEAPGEYGMAHLLEHMLFKGTQRQNDIPVRWPSAVCA